MVVDGELFCDGYSCAARTGIPLSDSGQLALLLPAGCVHRAGCCILVADAAQWDQRPVELLLMVVVLTTGVSVSVPLGEVRFAMR